MKKNILFLVLFFLAILNAKSQSKDKKANGIKQEIVVSEFDKMLDSLNVKGAILIYDVNKKTYYSNNFTWSKKGHLPASTFKIPNSIIALETGVMQNDSFVFKWNGEKRAMKTWEQDLTFKKAFQVSCVPCYQEIARKIGLKRMKFYLKELNYNSMVFDASTLDNFWLQGKSVISQMQQIDFLQRFYFSELPISNRTHAIMKNMMQIEKADSYILSGKTGWSTQNNIDNGWIVGYVEKDNSVYFFATNIEPKAAMEDFAATRINSTKVAFKKLKIIE